jgi:hypothetical protein
MERSSVYRVATVISHIAFDWEGKLTGRPRNFGATPSRLCPAVAPARASLSREMIMFSIGVDWPE